MMETSKKDLACLHMCQSPSYRVIMELWHLVCVCVPITSNVVNEPSWNFNQQQQQDWYSTHYSIIITIKQVTLYYYHHSLVWTSCWPLFYFPQVPHSHCLPACLLIANYLDPNYWRLVCHILACLGWCPAPKVSLHHSDHDWNFKFHFGSEHTTFVQTNEWTLHPSVNSLTYIKHQTNQSFPH
jgi:hypothetical protein